MYGFPFVNSSSRNEFTYGQMAMQKRDVDVIIVIVVGAEVATHTQIVQFVTLKLYCVRFDSELDIGIT